MIHIVILATLIGALLASLLAILPGLHVYNLLGLIILMIYALQEQGLAIGSEFYLPLMAGMVVSWATLNTIPSILLGAPDESALFMVMPGQKYLMEGRGYEGVMIATLGSLGGAFLLVCVIAPLAPFLLPIIQEVIAAHMHWILWIIITFILMTEWPKGGEHGQAGWRKFGDAWKTLGAGLATFALSGLYGFILLYRSPVSVEVAFQNIMPAFVGLFAIPWCLLDIFSKAQIPKQVTGDSLDIDGDAMLHGLISGGLGGSFAAFHPAVTGGVGGLLAGHATNQRDERAFIMSQGVSKMVYYAGALLFFFVPTLDLTRGGAAWIMQNFYQPSGYSDYFMIIGSIAIAAATAIFMMIPLAKASLWIVERVNYRYLSGTALLIIAGMVFGITGWRGVYVMLVGTGIGLLPVLFGSRRLNCLGVLLLPMACNMSNMGDKFASALGLL